MSTSVRLIVFDLGRVLVRICDSWDHACEVARLPVRLPPRDDARRARLLESTALMETGRIATAEFCQRVARVFEVEPSHVASIIDSYLLGAYPGVVELLDELNRAGYVTACLSNTQTEHWNQMWDGSARAALPMDRIQRHFASHLIGLRKPDDAAYAHVERNTGFTGGQIVFFDDMLENVEAARRRDWWAHQILQDADPIEQVRHHLGRHGVAVRS
jgi:glucose-1-phosphatase